MSSNLEQSPTTDEKTGSPKQGEPLFIEIGKIRRSHGIQGELLVHAFSDRIDYFRPGNTLYIGKKHQSIQVKTRRMTHDLLILSFSGLDNPESATLIANQPVFVQKEQLPRLPDGEYYHFQLIGLRVSDSSGKDIGVLSEVLETGANDVYLVTTDSGEEILLPVIPGVILSVDCDKNCMVVNPPEWA